MRKGHLKQFLNIFLCKSASKRKYCIILTILLLTLLSAAVLLWYTTSAYIDEFWSHASLSEEDIRFKLPYQYYKDLTIPRDISTKILLQPKVFVHNEVKQKMFITFFVKSAASNFELRQTIRQTWGLYSLVDDFHLVNIFLVGSVKNHKIQDVIKIESDCFQDLLQTDMHDSFHNLTLKTLTAFKWITTNMKDKSVFYVFVDDDVVINLAATVSFLKNKAKNGQPLDNRMYCGFQYEGKNGVIRGTHRLGTSWDQYPYQFYPSFCRGVMVILTFRMIEDIYKMSIITNFTDFPLEDVMVYGILRHKLGQDDANISPVINEAIPLAFYPWDHSPSVVQKMFHKWKIWEPNLIKNYNLARYEKYDNERCSSNLFATAKNGL